MEEDGRRWKKMEEGIVMKPAGQAVSRSGGQAVRPANETNKRAKKPKKAKKAQLLLPLTPSLTPSLPHSLTPSPAARTYHSLTHSPTHPPTHSHAELLAGCVWLSLPCCAACTCSRATTCAARPYGALVTGREGHRIASHRIASARPSRGSWRRGG